MSGSFSAKYLGRRNWLKLLRDYRKTRSTKTSHFPNQNILSVTKYLPVFDAKMPLTKQAKNEERWLYCRPPAPTNIWFFRLYDIKIAQESPGFDVFSGLPSNAIIALIWEPFKTMIYSLPKYLNELGAFSRISTTLSISEAVYVVYIPSSDYSENVTTKRCRVSISAARANYRRLNSLSRV